MSDRTILVTGAGGFIGGRLAQRIELEDRGEVRPLVHRLSGPDTIRLARLPVDIVQGSVTDRDRMDEVIAGCDAVVHCAVGTRDTIVGGTETVLEAAMAADVETFVHMSSAAIHGHGVEGVIREESPVRPDTSYAKAKAAVEHSIARRTDETELDPIRFRPFIVFGPFSEFVVDPLEDISTGAVLADGGEGLVNQIYVDNLIDAIFLAMETPEAAGETFLLRDDDAVTWREYYRALGEMMGEHPPFRELSRRRIKLRNQLGYASANVTPPFKLIGRIAASEEVHRQAAEELKRMPWAREAFARLPARTQTAIQEFLYGEQAPVAPAINGAENGDGGGDAQYSPPSERYADLHTLRGQVSNRKAKEVLGWEPRVPFDEAMTRIEAWFDYVEPVEA